MTKYLRKQIKGEEIYFSSWFQRFESIASGPVHGEADHYGREHVVGQGSSSHGG
jgi:hypothetical protein